jgi:hypothetical protein
VVQILLSCRSFRINSYVRVLSINRGRLIPRFKEILIEILNPHGILTRTTSHHPPQDFLAISSIACFEQRAVSYPSHTCSSRLFFCRLSLFCFRLLFPVFSPRSSLKKQFLSAGSDSSQKHHNLKASKTTNRHPSCKIFDFSFKVYESTL